MKCAATTCGKAIPSRRSSTFGALRPAAAPIVGRMQAMWESMRDSVIRIFPKAPGLPKDKDGYLRFLDEIYQTTLITPCRSKVTPSRLC